MSVPEGYEEAVRRVALKRQRRERRAAVDKSEHRFPTVCLYALHVAVPIIFGLEIAVLWGAPSGFPVSLLERWGLSRTVVACRELALPFSHHLSTFVVHSVPVALWVYAATAAGLLIWGGHNWGDHNAWGGHKARVKWIFAAIPFAVAVVLQISPSIRNLDLVAYATATLLAARTAEIA